jgi:hypothetical protein
VVAFGSDRERDECLTSAMRASATVIICVQNERGSNRSRERAFLTSYYDFTRTRCSESDGIAWKKIIVDLCARRSSSLFKVITEMKSFNVRCTAQTNQQSVYIMLAQWSRRTTVAPMSKNGRNESETFEVRAKIHADLWSGTTTSAVEGAYEICVS